MPRFVFRFESVLKYRRHRRDLCRTLLAGLMDNDRVLEKKRIHLESRRREQLNEIRDLAGENIVDVDRAASRRFYAGQLVSEIGQVWQQRLELGQQIEHYRQTLVEADRDVKIMEKLEEKQRLDFEAEQSRRAHRELEDVWFSTHAMEYSQ